jgi:hypothetical protein
MGASEPSAEPIPSTPVESTGSYRKLEEGRVDHRVLVERLVPLTISFLSSGSQTSSRETVG